MKKICCHSVIATGETEQNGPAERVALGIMGILSAWRIVYHGEKRLRNIPVQIERNLSYFPPVCRKSPGDRGRPIAGTRLFTEIICWDAPD